MVKKPTDDQEFFEMQLATLFPSAGGWPSEHLHHKALLAAANECTALVRAARNRCTKIDANRDLTPEAKKRQRAELADEFINKLETSQTLSRAHEVAEEALAKYQATIDSNLKPATDPHEVGVHQQIRDQLRAITDPKQRLNFLARHGNDVTLITAALGAPAFVSGLSDAEVALLRRNVEQHADPAIIKERDFVTSALAEVERGHRAARSRIAKLGGVEKGSTVMPSTKQEPIRKEPTTKEPTNRAVNAPT